MVARTDLVTDPAVTADLVLARRGTAYFSRKLNELTDDEYDAPSLLPGWSRRHVIAHVGYNARALTRLVEWAGTGVPNPMYPSPQARVEEIDYGATLSPIALRNLHHHALVTLSVHWRDLPAGRWEHPVVTGAGRTVPVSVTPWLRSREVWLHAIDLDNGAAFADLPPEFCDRLLVDVVTSWQHSGAAKDLVLVPTDRAVAGMPVGVPAVGPVVTIKGTVAELARWASGRGTDPGCGPISDAGTISMPPRWL